MAAQSTRTARRLLLTPQEPLVAGGPAEEFERRIQDIFKSGFEHLVIDMKGVSALDSAGVRALVRGHTTAQRLHRRFTLVSPNKNVREVLELSLLAKILEVVDTVVEAQERTIPWNHVLTSVGVIVAGAAMVAVGTWWPNFGNADYPIATATGIPGVVSNEAPALMHPMFELGKLVAAAVIGMLVTLVHRQYRTERLPNPMMDQAHSASPVPRASSAFARQSRTLVTSSYSSFSWDSAWLPASARLPSPVSAWSFCAR
jgi:anti-anti-sigma factor